MISQPIFDLIVRFVPEAILVLVFIWFTLKLTDIFINFVKARDAEYRKFIDDISTRQTEALRGLMGEMREMNKALMDLRESLK